MSALYPPVAAIPNRAVSSNRPLSERGSGSGEYLDDPNDFGDVSDFDEACSEPLTQQLYGTEAQVIGNYFVCAQGTIDLRGSVKTRRLLQAFCSAPNQRCNLAHVLRQVYDIETLENRSARYNKSVRIRAIKLVSRTRRKLKKTFGGTQYQWFAHDRSKKDWVLGRAELPVRYLS